MKRSEIQEVVFDAIDMANNLREDDTKMPLSVDTELYSANGYLDSMGLVSFLLDVEESLQIRGVQITLGDERAMSQTSSPFRSVQTLIEYIESSIEQ